MVRLDLFYGRVDLEGLGKNTTVAELMEAQSLFCRLHPDLCADCGGRCCKDSEIWVDNVFCRQQTGLREEMLFRDNGEVLWGDTKRCAFQLQDGRCGRYQRPRPLVCQLFFCDSKAAEYYVRLVQCLMETYHWAVLYENMLAKLGPDIRQLYPLRNACANPVCNKRDYETSIYEILLFLQDFYQKNQREFEAMGGQAKKQHREQARMNGEDLFLTQSVLTHYFGRRRIELQNLTYTPPVDNF